MFFVYLTVVRLGTPYKEQQQQSRYHNAIVDFLATLLYSTPYKMYMKLLGS